MRLIVRFLKDENGATAIEYGLIAAGIAVAIIHLLNGLDGAQIAACEIPTPFTGPAPQRPMPITVKARRPTG
jgi:pilus assembly protein Flp/PilA